MSDDQPLEFANVGAQLLEPVAQSNRYAITNVDEVGVIERFRFAGVAREVAQWAHLMREKGLRTGDRVVVVAGRAWQWRCALLGVLQAGGVAVACPASLPVAEIRAIAAHAGAALLVSIRARLDLVERAGSPVLSSDELETLDAAEALAQPPHQSMPGDVALILYSANAAGLHGTMHTHASLIAQADAGRHWLGVGEDERVWCTAADGSAASIWLLLAAWRERANIVIVDLELDPEAQLELLDRLRPAAVWFSNEEYGVLASATAPAWIDLGSIRRALISDESSAGATAFAGAFGATVAPLFGLKELGVVAGWPAGAERDAVTGTALPVPGIRLAIVDEQGAELPSGQVGDVVVRGDAQSLFAGYKGGGTPRPDSWFHLGWRGALRADRGLRLASGSPVENELVEAAVDIPGAELVDKGRRSKREAKRARRREERQAKERQKAEERRRREEEKSRELAERAAAKERKEAKRAEREAAEAEARRRAEDDKRREREQRHEEKQARHRQAKQAKERRKAEAARAEREAAEAAERRRAEEAARAEREAAEAEERRRADEAARAEREAAEAEERRREEEERRRAEDAKRLGRRQRRDEKQARRREEQQAKEREKAEAAERAEREAEERRRAEEVERAQREAARAEERRRAEEERRRAEYEKRREREQRRDEKEARRREEQQAKEAARAQRKAARAGKRRRPKESGPAENGKRREKEPRRGAAEQSEPERLTADILSRIKQYGMTGSPVEPDERRDAEASTERDAAAEPNARRDASE